jgi:hypothetical protein
MDYRTASAVDKSVILAAIEAGTVDSPALIRPLDVDDNGAPVGRDVLIYSSANPEGVLVGICTWVELAQILAQATTSESVVSGAGAGTMSGDVPDTVRQQEAEVDAELRLKEVRLAGQLEKIRQQRAAGSGRPQP